MITKKQGANTKMLQDMLKKPEVKDLFSVVHDITMEGSTPDLMKQADIYLARIKRSYGVELYNECDHIYQVSLNVNKRGC